MIVSPSSGAIRSASSSNITKVASPRSPFERMKSTDLLVTHQVDVDLLDRLELPVRALLRDEDAGVAALERVVVADVVEVPDPAVDPEEVERGGADEVDRGRVRPEERPDLRDPVQVRAPRSVAPARSRRRRPAGGPDHLRGLWPARLGLRALRGLGRFGWRFGDLRGLASFAAWDLRFRLRALRELRSAFAASVDPCRPSCRRFASSRSRRVASPCALPGLRVVSRPATPAATPAILRCARSSRRPPGRLPSRPGSAWTWRPTGRPSSPTPIGSESAGKPPRLASYRNGAQSIQSGLIGSSPIAAGWVVPWANASQPSVGVSST